MKTVKNIITAHQDRCVEQDFSSSPCEIKKQYNPITSERWNRTKIIGEWDHIFSIDPGTTCTDRLKAIKAYGKKRNFALSRKYIDLHLKSSHPVNKELEQQLNDLFKEEKDEEAYTHFMNS